MNRRRTGKSSSCARRQLHGLAVAAVCALFAVAGPAARSAAEELALEEPQAPAVPPDPEILPQPVAAPATPTDSATTRASRSAAAPIAAPPSTRKVRLEGAEEIVIRTGPGQAYAVAGVYKPGDTFLVIAKSGDWYDVRLSPTETGWVHAALCHEYDDMSDLEFRPNPKVYSRTGAYALGIYGGGYAYDRKSNALVLGARLGYYVFDRVQAEVGVGWTRVDRPAEIVESLFDLSLEAEKYDMGFYELGATYEILPGRQMVPYVTGGVGSALMQGRSEASYNFGIGTFLFLNKKTLTRWEIRDYRFTSGPPDARRSNNNIAFTFGSSILF